MVIIILNYITRALTIVMGIILLINPFAGLQANGGFVRTVGGIMTVFGLYRLITYRMFLKRVREQEEREAQQATEQEERENQ